MPAFPSNNKSPTPSNPLAIPSSWTGLVADSATADWKDAYPVAQGGKGKPGSKGRLLVVAEVSVILRCGNATVRKYLRLGVLNGHRVGDHWRVYEAALEEFVSAKPAAASPDLHLLDLNSANGSTAVSIGSAQQLPISLERTKLKPEGGAT